MSYAIIRNEKYKRENLKGIYRHNERRNKNYSNKNINQELSYLNYSLKDCKHSYEKEFELIREKYNLKGQIKTVSNIACEYIITSDYDYFERISDRIVSFIAKHSNTSKEAIEKMMVNTKMLTKDLGTILVGEDAVKAGLINEVGGISQAFAKLSELMKKNTIE